MATSFPNSIRSLQIHDPRKTTVGLILSSLLLLAWFIWFLMAQITLYEISKTIPITAQEVVVVSFPTEANALLEKGQTAFLTLDGPQGSDIGPVPAVVLGVDHALDDNIEAAVLIFWDAVDPIQFNPNLTGRIEVEIEHVTPATVVMRSARSAIGVLPAPDTIITNEDD